MAQPSQMAEFSTAVSLIRHGSSMHHEARPIAPANPRSHSLRFVYSSSDIRSSFIPPEALRRCHSQLIQSFKIFSMR